jgi:hypothetical protein
MAGLACPSSAVSPSKGMIRTRRRQEQTLHGKIMLN